MSACFLRLHVCDVIQFRDDHAFHAEHADPRNIFEKQILKVWTPCLSAFYCVISRATLAWSLNACAIAGFSKSARARTKNYKECELSNSTPKSLAESRSRTPTNTASKFLKFVYQKCCVDRLRFQNIYRLNRGPYLSQLDLKEKCTRHAGVSTNEADLFDRHDHRAGKAK